MKDEKELPSNKEIFVTACGVLAIFLCGYVINIQEHRSVVADLRGTITDLQIENMRLKRDNITEKSNLLVQYTMTDLICRKRVADLEKALSNN